MTLSDAAPMELVTGSASNRDLAAGAKEQFQVSLNTGQLLRFLVEKGDLALSVILYDPDGQKLTEQVSQRYEILELSVLAESAGKYLLEIHSLEHQESPRHYILKVEPTRPTTTADQKTGVAQRLAASASMLRADWTEKSLRQAIQRYDDAAAIWFSLHDSRKAATATMEAGEICFLLGEYQEALKRYGKAAEREKSTGDRLGQSEALSESGRLYSYLGDNVKAKNYVLEALKILAFDRQIDQAVDVKKRYAEELSILGEVNYSKGDLLKSSKLFKEALSLFNEIADRNGTARAHLFIGYIAGGLGDAEKAETELSQALALYRGMTNRSGEGLALTALGLWHSFNRDEEHAIRMHREAIDIFRGIGDRQSEAIAHNGLGQAYENLTEYATALDNYRDALRLFQDNHNLDFASVSTCNVARSYRLNGDLNQSLDYYEQCFKLTRAAGKVRTEANALNSVAVIYATQGNRDKTIRQYRRILKFYSTMSDRQRQAAALNNLGDFYLHIGERQSAVRSYKEALALCEQAGDKGVLISSLYNLARAQCDLGELDLALANIKDSIRIIEELRTNVSSPDFRSSYFSGVRRNYDLYIDILMQLDRRRPGQGFAVAGLIVSETARARSLVDVLTEAHANIRQGAAPELLTRERELRALLRSQAQYQMELSMTGKERAETKEVERQINDLRNEYQEIEAQLRDENSRTLALTRPAALTLQQIQTELRDGDTILLEYALGDERSYLWTVTADSVRSYQLPPRATLEDAAREVYKLLTARQAIDEKNDGTYQAKVEAADSSYHQKALALSQMLLGPVAEQLGTKRLIVVTEGVLQYVPFDPLPAPLAATLAPVTQAVATSSDDLPLIDTNEIVTLPSMSTLAAIRQEKHRIGSGDKIVAVLADPVFSESDDRVQNGPPGSIITPSASDETAGPVVRGLDGLVRGGPVRLLHASEEADAIVATMPQGSAKVAKGFDASRETAMSSFVSEYQIVHFATHGFFNSEHPELSGIVLSMVKPDGSKTDGFMPLQDICRLNLSAPLVVLSACETGLGKDIKGEGLMSLTRGFMYAGSQTVVTSLWKVDDRATAELMKDFYKSMLQTGMTPAAALRSAKQKIRQKPAWSAPYFWAGFVLQGEYKASIVVDRSSGLRTSLAIAITLVLISFGLTVLQRRRRRSYMRSHS
jgi:CHAT domain-containing protein/lipopolysaccharide biosynthesis regulator YciM